MKKIMSLDVESDGIWGKPFAIGAICYDECGNKVDRIALRLPDGFVKNEWVKENVLPTLNFPVTHDNENKCLTVMSVTGVKTCLKSKENQKKHSPTSWSVNPIGFYEATCKSCRESGDDVFEIDNYDNVYKNMLKDFAKFYSKYKESGYEILWHMGHIVESNLFKEMRNLNIIGDWDAPYVPIEVSAYLAQIGEQADSVDSYAEKFKINISNYGSTHNPLYDCEVAYRVYEHIYYSSK